MKKPKFDSDTALARIKVLMNRYYADCGRGFYSNSDNDFAGLLEEIDDILDNVDIDRKKIIIESLDMDNKGRENFK